MQTSEITDARRAWREANVSPLWENALAHGTSRPIERAHVWPWATMKPLIDDALGRRGMDVIERRVLSLINPEQRLAAGPCTVTNINAGLQILAPGESARPHRHSMNALRFVIEGSGATTVVDGKRCVMNEGDLVLTPGWTWHEHEHEGSRPIVWLDVLDAQLHRYLGTDAFEPGPAHDVPDNEHVTYSFPWAAAVDSLARAKRGPDGAKRHRYTNPRTGGSVMTLLDCYAVEISPGERTFPMRTSSHSVVAVVEGRGTTTVGDQTFTWGPKDVFSLPDGNWIGHRAEELTRFFVATDREILRRLDLLSEEYRST